VVANRARSIRKAGLEAQQEASRRGACVRFARNEEPREVNQSMPCHFSVRRPLRCVNSERPWVQSVPSLRLWCWRTKNHRVLRLVQIFDERRGARLQRDTPQRQPNDRVKSPDLACRLLIQLQARHLPYIERRADGYPSPKAEVPCLIPRAPRRVDQSDLGATDRDAGLQIGPNRRSNLVHYPTVLNGESIHIPTWPNPQAVQQDAHRLPSRNRAANRTIRRVQSPTKKEAVSLTPTRQKSYFGISDWTANRINQIRVSNQRNR
jgi:hypothetical protein